MAQTNRDIIREPGGKLLIDGQQSTIEVGLVQIKRVFVSTQLAVHLDDPLSLVAQLGSKEVEFANLPTDPADLDADSIFLLRAAGIIPGD